MKKKLISRILKTELVEWRQLKWLQGELKEISDNNLARLKTSLIEEDFVAPFYVWEEKPGHTWILDGHHRKRAMEEIEEAGTSIPDKLDANLISCKNKKEAQKLVLIYSAIYANPTMDGLDLFLSDSGIDIRELRPLIDIPSIDLDQFEKWYTNKNEFKPIEFPEGANNGLIEIIIKLEPHRFDAKLKDQLEQIGKEYKCEIIQNEPQK